MMQCGLVQCKELPNPVIKYSAVKWPEPTDNLRSTCTIWTTK